MLVCQGYPVPRITWVFNGVRRLSTSHKLEIPSLSLSDAGIYQVESGEWVIGEFWL